MKMIYATAEVSARRNKKLEKIRGRARFPCIIHEDDEGYRRYNFAIEVVDEPATALMVSDLRRCGFEVEVLTEVEHLKNLGMLSPSKMEGAAGC